MLIFGYISRRHKDAYEILLALSLSKVEEVVYDKL